MKPVFETRVTLFLSEYGTEFFTRGGSARSCHQNVFRRGPAVDGDQIP
jgi:hypothetical protein